MNRKQVEKLIRKDSNLQENIDEMVIDMHTSLASQINNDGPSIQLKWLEEVCGITPDEVLEQIGNTEDGSDDKMPE